MHVKYYYLERFSHSLETEYLCKYMYMLVCLYCIGAQDYLSSFVFRYCHKSNH